MAKGKEDLTQAYQKLKKVCLDLMGVAIYYSDDEESYDLAQYEQLDWDRVGMPVAIQDRGKRARAVLSEHREFLSDLEGDL